MAQIDDILIPSLTVEEILSDGSTLTNPAADHRRLFLGEDGQLHVKDSAGAVTGIGGAGGVAADAIWDAAGDLAVGSGADTAAKLTAGASGTLLGSSGSALSWGYGRMLGYTVDTVGDRSITSATLADLPTTATSVTFTAPGSGKVLVRLNAVAGASTTANAIQSWGLREAAVIIAGSTSASFATRQPGSGSENYGARSMTFYISGLTPGNSYTYKWAAAQSAGTGTLVANPNAPAIMEVWSVA
jgi:hypothetical protein